MKWRENFAVKALAFTAAVAAFTATAIMSWYQLANFDALWGDAYLGDESHGYTQTYLVRQDFWMVRSLVAFKEQVAAGEELSLAEKRAMERLEAQYDAGATNLRWQLLDQDGKIIYGNTQEDSTQVRVDYLEDYSRSRMGILESNSGWDYWVGPESRALNWADYTAVRNNTNWRSLLPQLVEAARVQENAGEVGVILTIPDGDTIVVPLDAALMDDDGYTNYLWIQDSDGWYLYLPTVRACLEGNRFGYIFDPDGLEWALTPEAADEANKKSASLILWVDDALRVDDQYRKAALKMEEWQAGRTGYLALTLVLGTAGVLLMVYLCCGAGHKRGVEGIYLNWFHRAPGDVLLFLLFFGGVGSVGIAGVTAIDTYMDAPMYIQLICVGLGVSATAALGMAALITVCARVKAHTLLRNTWTWAICAWCWKVFVRLWGWCWELLKDIGRGIGAVPLIWKAVVVCMAYPIFTLATIRWAGGLWLLVSFLCGLYLCAWAYQWKRIRHGAQQIIGGNPNYHIDTNRMLPDLKGHADELNNLGHAISTAVDERMKSEHFKAELITNVSHDLKTPLTSIINYVDLLKKVDISDPKAQEYIEVLDRKSQRLKKLTEDLVEASKASTGNLTVNWERLDWAQLTDQALAETGERLEAQRLTVIRTLPAEPLWVEADGRHLWRVLDNLLTNCAKYALPGTRVYVDLRRSGDWAVLSVKNISRDPLDIPAERLMERFVRGDESRNQAGSGLGLSIAQSLTELQHGRFDISIDGDLFKAIVTLPLAGGKPEDPIQLFLSQP